MSRRAYLVWLIVIVAGLIYWWKPSPNVESATDYQRISNNVQTFNGYTMTNLAAYEGQFRVLSRENYRSGREAELSPVDFALGWGTMADPSVYKQISIRQSNRWYYWRYENQPPIPREQIETQSANTHLIPANSSIAKQLADIDQDDLIYLKGHLVEVTAGDGWTWRSSLTRNDTGNGACELMLVEEVKEL